MALSQAERNLLCRSTLLIDEGYTQRIREAAPSAPVPFTVDELDDLAGYVAACANHTRSKKTQDALDVVSEKIERSLELAASTGCKGGEQLAAMLGQLDAVCREVGINLDRVLERMKPARIESHETVALTLSHAEKELLLAAPETSAAVRSKVHDARPARRKCEFTLAEIEAIEAVAGAAARRDPPATERGRWSRLQRKLRDLQARYATGDEHADRLALQELLSGRPASQAAAVRALFAEAGIRARRRAGKVRATEFPTDPMPRR